MSNLLEDKLRDHVVIFDGATGTELYNRNFFVNSCYEYLNLTNPDTVLQVHAAYVEAGAEVLTTNSYGANRIRLGRHALAEQIVQINTSAVHLARRAGGDEVLVAASVGPLGRIGGRNCDPVAVFGEQIEILQKAGADFIIAETIPSFAEARNFLRAVEKYGSIPYMMSFAVDRELDLAMGEKLAVLLPELSAAKVPPAAIGLNCGIGPEPMLEALEKLMKLSVFPVVAQPNAGVPKNVDNRTIYMCSPEYLTTYAVRFVNLGVRGVGGCCGTTPAHIADLARSVRPLRHTPAVLPVIELSSAKPVEPLPEVPVAERSKLAAKVARGEFVKLAEITPPRGFDLRQTIERARLCREAGIDAINIPDGPRASSRISSIVTASEIEKNAGIETILHCCCRDKNLIGMQADLLGCAYLGIRNILFVTGDPPKLGDYPFASGVFDVDSIGILKVAAKLNRGLDIGGRSLGDRPTAFYPGAGIDPNAVDFDREVRRMREKAEAGARFFITQPVFSLDPLDRVLAVANELGVPLFAGIWPLASYRNAEFMRNEVPGVVVPDEIMRRMEAASTREEQYACGIAIARETVAELRGRVAGVQVSAPFGRVESVFAVFENQ
ncbi:MAG: bifunctional homocysteine S-methyltransferase/methylenetetrahydrofolate reductase [Victivallaceae bacterium]|nr:bifunctional homocysteine S-methyltransferase/methylenetetrahydrofolate reductase [Victivallaceae bacterium]